MGNRTSSTKELLWYKLPTCIGDLCIYFCIVFILTTFDSIWLSYERMTYISLFCLITTSYLLAVAIYPIRLNDRKMSYWSVLRRAIWQVAITIVLFCIIIYATYNSFHISFYLILSISSVIAISIWHIIVKSAINKLRSSGRNTRQVVIVGADDNAISLYNSIRCGYGLYGYNILGFFTDYSIEEKLPDNARLLGRARDVLSYLPSHHVHEVYCSINPAIDGDFINKIIHTCETHFIKFYYVPNMEGYIRRKMTFEEFGSVNIISLRDEPLENPVSRLIKRLFDIIVSGVFLLCIFPFVFIFVAVGIKLSSSGPIFFKQARTGYRGEPFNCLKFRTMHVNADCDKLQATEDDPRKFKFGNLLRRTSIDELPQFINILKGEMSLIGPRPHMEYHTEIYSKLIEEYLIRHLVKPGLSGWAQVNGCRGETKTVAQMKARVEHDIWYIEHWTFGLDIKIMFMTIRQILVGDKQAY